MDTVRNFVAITLLLGIALVLTGCTVLGLGVGLIVDQQVNEPFESSAADSSEIPRNRQVLVHCLDGSTLSGTSMGVVRLPDTLYNEHLAEARISLTRPKPSAISALAMESDGRVNTVPFRNIQHISVGPGHSRYWLLGLGIGVVIDAFVVAAMVKGLEDSGGFVNMAMY